MYTLYILQMYHAIRLNTDTTVTCGKRTECKVIQIEWRWKSSSNKVYCNTQKKRLQWVSYYIYAKLQSPPWLIAPFNKIQQKPSTLLYPSNGPKFKNIFIDHSDKLTWSMPSRPKTQNLEVSPEIEFHTKGRLTCRGREKRRGKKVVGCQLAGSDMFFDPAHRHSDFRSFLQIVLCVSNTRLFNHTYVTDDTISIWDLPLHVVFDIEHLPAFPCHMHSAIYWWCMLVYFSSRKWSWVARCPSFTVLDKSITDSMEQSISWEANSSSASRQIPYILWNPKVHYRIHKSTPPIPVLSQINLDHAPHPTSWISTLILSSYLCLRLSSGLFLTGFLTKTILSPIHATYPVHFILLELITWIIFGEEYRSYAPHYVVFSTPLSPFPSEAQISSSAPYCQIPLACIPPSLPHSYKRQNCVNRTHKFL